MCVLADLEPNQMFLKIECPSLSYRYLYPSTILSHLRFDNLYLQIAHSTLTLSFTRTVLISRTCIYTYHHARESVVFSFLSPAHVRPEILPSKFASRNHPSGALFLSSSLQRVLSAPKNISSIHHVCHLPWSCKDQPLNSTITVALTVERKPH